MLSRETINKVLARNNQNGYQKEFKRWKFFRAKAPDALWQIDFKGPFTVQGKKYWFLVCIDDYSRFIIAAEQFNHELTTAEVTAVLEKQRGFRRLFCLIMDHSSKSSGKAGAASIVLKRILRILLIPQDKGKVERCIQNLNREFINPLRKFPGWLKGQISEYRDWFNHSRFHRGIKAFPAELYKCNVGKLT